MDLIKHELYKIFSNKSVLILFIIVTIFSGVYFTAEIHYSKVDNTVISNMTQKLEGPITESKVEKASLEIERSRNMNSQQSPWVANPKRLFEFNAYSKLVAINRAYMIKQADLMKINIENNGAKGFPHKNNVLLYGMLTATSINEFHYTAGWDIIVGYANSFGAVIMAAFILLGLSAMFCGEYASRMDSIILSSKYGKTKLIKAKLVASILYILGLILFFNLLNLVANIGAFGIHGWNSPIQCLIGFENSPYKFSVLQYYFLQLLIHSAACIVFGLFVLLVSTLSKTRIVTFFIGVFTFVVPFLVDNAIPMKKTLADLVVKFSCSWAMQGAKLFKSYRTYDFFDNPVLYPIVVIGLLVVLLPVFCIAIDKTFKNHGMNF